MFNWKEKKFIIQRAKDLRMIPNSHHLLNGFSGDFQAMYDNLYQQNDIDLHHVELQSGSRKYLMNLTNWFMGHFGEEYLLAFSRTDLTGIELLHDTMKRGPYRLAIFNQPSNERYAFGRIRVLGSIGNPDFDIVFDSSDGVFKMAEISMILEIPQNDVETFQGDDVYCVRGPMTDHNLFVFQKADNGPTVQSIYAKRIMSFVKRFNEEAKAYRAG